MSKRIQEYIPRPSLYDLPRFGYDPLNCFSSSETFRYLSRFWKILSHQTIFRQSSSHLPTPTRRSTFASILTSCFFFSVSRFLSLRCSSMERLERCLQAASTDAGCRDEVRFIVEHMTATARRLIHSLYKIQCNKVDCSSAAGRVVGDAPWSLLVLSSLAVLAQIAFQRNTLMALR